MIELDRLVLRDILHAVQPATPARGGSLPALSAVRLRARGALLTASGTDLDLKVEATGPLQVDDADLDVAVKRSHLAKAVVSGGPTVRLDHDGEHLTVQPDDGLTIRLRTMPLEDLPVWAEADVPFGCELSPDELADVAAICGAASTDVARPVLTGVGVDDTGMWAATDSYRLAWRHIEGTADTLAGKVVPARLWQMVARWGDPDPVQVAQFDDVVRVAGIQARGRGGCRIVQVVATQHLVDGTFPTVAELLPDADAVKLAVTVDAGRLTGRIDAVRRMSSVVSGGLTYNTPLALQVDNDLLTMSFGMRGQLDIDAAVPIKEFAGDTDVAAAFNPTYLGQAIAITGHRGEDPTATIELVDDLKPGVVTGSSPVRVLLMPMRVN